MPDLLPFLKSMLSVSGLPAYETPVARLIENRWKPLADEFHTTRLGSLHALRRGTGKSPRPSLLIATHMDAIGLMVRKIVDGFLYVTNVGGIDVRVLPGASVRVHATGGGRPSDLPGILIQPPDRLLPGSARKDRIALEDLLVDTGLLPGQVARRVQVGDLISFDAPPVELSGGVLSGHSLDNRASIAALTLCLQELNSRPHAWDVWAAATTQEEVTFAGAATSAFQLRPAIAVAVDVTFARGPGAGGWQTFPMGKGVTLGLGPNIHPFVHARFKETAHRLEIPYHLEPIPTDSGTDAQAMQIAAGGIPTMVAEIPMRYMHTPAEMVSLNDIRRMGRLLAEFAAGLETDFLETLAWD